ncbi:MAG: DUF1232 domain-containing protein [Synechococcales cyanobacterium RU_4_20]|nr:DUF1232 domain-containing protein [Synechococcales cyanobacterium RU_4_20]NJR69087.1 DUF1232 domain-containing protein [Synechococcales cyanobacterium CRU_2_2]
MKSLLQPLYAVYRAILKHPKYRWIAIAASFFYLVSPVDFITDFMPIIGWIDDGMVATLLVTEISQILLEKRKQRQETTAPEDAEIIAI